MSCGLGWVFPCLWRSCSMRFEIEVRLVSFLFLWVLFSRASEVGWSLALQVVPTAAHLPNPTTLNVAPYPHPLLCHFPRLLLLHPSCDHPFSPSVQVQKRDCASTVEGPARREKTQRTTELARQEAAVRRRCCPWKLWVNISSSPSIQAYPQRIAVAFRFLRLYDGGFSEQVGRRLL